MESFVLFLWGFLVVVKGLVYSALLSHFPFLLWKFFFDVWDSWFDFLYCSVSFRLFHFLLALECFFSLALCLFLHLPVHLLCLLVLFACLLPVHFLHLGPSKTSIETTGWTNLTVFTNWSSYSKFTKIGLMWSIMIGPATTKTLVNTRNIKKYSKWP